MQETNFEEIYRLSGQKIARVSLGFKRYLYPQIDWSDPLICLKGARGVGKTTLLLQKIKESEDRKTTLYVSLDSIWLDPRDVYQLVRHHYERCGTRVVLDEVHYMDGWQRLIKNLCDDFPGLRIAYTGSSLLKLKAGGGDLSRRQREFCLNGLSFREYLEMENAGKFGAMTLQEIIDGHEDVGRQIVSGLKILPHWEKYFRSGYYPFYRDCPGGYSHRLLQAVNQTLESDWASVEDVSATTVRRARKMLRILAGRPPQTPKMNALYGELDTDRKTGLKILHALADAELLILFASAKNTLKTLSAPDKMYCNNPNLAYALTPDADIGSAREAWFINQLRVGHEVLYPKAGDVEVDGASVFEIGGRGKGFGQIKDVPGSYVANDGVETGYGNKIPLWMFGFLY